jgi:hypothetical protein
MRAEAQQKLIHLGSRKTELILAENQSVTLRDFFSHGVLTLRDLGAERFPGIQMSDLTPFFVDCSPLN